jgi:hypothetical protein
VQISKVLSIKINAYFELANLNDWSRCWGIIVISGFGILLQSILWCLWVGGCTGVGQLFDFVNNLQI